MEIILNMYTIHVKLDKKLTNGSGYSLVCNKDDLRLVLLTLETSKLVKCYRVFNSDCAAEMGHKDLGFSRSGYKKWVYIFSP